MLHRAGTGTGNHCYRPQRSWQGYVFTGMCDSVHRHPPEQKPPPPQSMLGDTVNTQVLHILLECNLVFYCACPSPWSGLGPVQCVGAITPMTSSVGGKNFQHQNCMGIKPVSPCSLFVTMIAQPWSFCTGNTSISSVRAFWAWIHPCKPHSVLITGRKNNSWQHIANCGYLGHDVILNVREMAYVVIRSRIRHVPEV